MASRAPRRLVYKAAALPQAEPAADQRIVRKYCTQRGFIGHNGNDTTIKRHLAPRAAEK
jgi:hypothetical protein